MDSPQPFHRLVTRLVGRFLDRHPEALERMSIDEIRRAAAEELRAEFDEHAGRPPIPAAFLDAFAKL